MTEYHYKLKGNKIVANDGHGGWSEIATIINNRACRQLLRHVQLAEDVELLMDRFISDTMADKVPCPGEPSNPA